MSACTLNQTCGPRPQVSELELSRVFFAKVLVLVSGHLVKVLVLVSSLSGQGLGLGLEKKVLVSFKRDLSETSDIKSSKIWHHA